MIFEQGDEMDEAVGRIVEILEEHPEGGIAKEQLRAAAASGENADLAQLVEDIFAKADADQDAVLSREQRLTFRDLFEEAVLGDDMEDDSDASAEA